MLKNLKLLRKNLKAPELKSFKTLERYANANLKIFLYVRVHPKTILKKNLRFES